MRIFSEKAVDEIVILDIDATKNSKPPQFDYLKTMARAANVPLCYGGGVKTVEHAKKIIGLGFEKVAISSAAVEDPAFIGRMSDEIGVQSVVVVLDVLRRKNCEGSPYEVFTHGGTKKAGGTLQSYLERLASCPVGEIVINNIERDGLMSGYDIELGKQVKSQSKVPVSMLGGAGSMEDVRELLSSCGHIGCAAGSLFVFKGALKAVLITYPTLYGPALPFSRSFDEVINYNV